MAGEPIYDVTRAGALENLLSQMPGGSTDEPLSRHRSIDGPGPALADALNELEAALRAMPPAGDAGTPWPQLRDRRDALLAATDEPLDRRIVELMSRLFEAALRDPRLPPAFRRVVARLQASAVHVALVDATLLTQHDHPVWRLLNRIASAAETYTRPSDPRLAAMRAFCDTLVDDVARASVQDAVLYKQATMRLDAFLGEQLREQQRRARPAADTLARIEQRDATELHLSSLLAEQLEPTGATPAVRHFITTAWAKVLAQAMQEHGEKAQPTLAVLRTTDDLLWSLHPPDHPQGRKRLVAMLPGLLQRLREGLASIGMPAPEQQLIFDQLMAVHTEVLRPARRAAQPDDGLTPEQIVQRLREERVWAPSSRPPFSDSVIDLPGAETAWHDTGRPPGHDIIDTMRPGDRQRVLSGGRWTRVQLLWRSERGGYFLFAGTDPSRTHSLTRSALLRMADAGSITPLDDVSLVQRAVDSLMQALAPPG